MAAEDSTPSEFDDELLEGLRDLAARLDPEPEQVRAGALAAFSWRTIDAELAMLMGDQRDRSLTFEGGGLTVHLEIGADGVIVGRLLPLGTPEVEVCWDGGSTIVAVDGAGAFRATAVPAGPVRLRCQGPGVGVVTTDWIVL